MTSMSIRRTTLTSLVGATLIAGVFVGTATATPSGAATTPVLVSSQFAAQVTPDQVQVAEDALGPEAKHELEHLMAENSQQRALPIAAVAIAAAAWCTKGALGSIPASILNDISNGGEGGGYVRNAIIGCLAGELGTVWRFTPQWVKNQAIAAVAAVIIRLS